MLNIFYVLILGIVVYVLYYLFTYLIEIRNLLEEQRDQNEQIIDLLEEQNPDRNQW